MWTCPRCQRIFGRRNQLHECAPAMSLEEYFSTGPARERPIFEAVMRWLEPLGPLVVEPVSVGILVKRSRTFVELRPRRDWEALSFILSHQLEHPRVARRIGMGAQICHVVNLRGPGEVDDLVGAWLTESYLDSPA